MTNISFQGYFFMRYIRERNFSLGICRIVLVVFLVSVGCREGVTQGKYTLHFRFEDDFLHYNGHGSDRYYTGGMELGFTAVHTKPKRTGNRWCIRQNIYTPAVITTAIPPFNDYPYAGELLLHYKYNVTDTTGSWGWEWYGSLGATGKYSFAEPFQKEVHRWIAYKRPMGWDSVVEAGPLIQTGGSYWMRLAGDEWGGWYGRVSAEAGTIHRHLSLSGIVILGRKAAEAPFPWLVGRQITRGKKGMVHIFFTPEVIWVMYNRLLDLGLRANPLSIDGAEKIQISPWLVRTQTGVMVDFPSVSLRLVQHYTTKEFKAARPHAFGEISIFYHW